MATEVTTAEKIRRLPWNLGLNAANNIFAQLTFFGSVFILFLNELGASNSQIGFLLAMLPFTGLVALFIAPAVARFGYKRTFVTFFGLRKVVAAALLLVPFVSTHYGNGAALTLMTIIMFAFALSRSISETGLYPWSQEFIPNSIRGKHSSLNDIIGRLTTIAALAFAGYVLGLSAHIDRYTLLFAIALVFGGVAVWSATHLPGGAPTETETTSYRKFGDVIRDRNFVWYVTGLSLATLGAAALAFLPLYMQNQIGLSDSAVVWVQIGTTVGGLSATYLMGWAADRYGSKPVLLQGLYFKALLPIGFLLIPRLTDLSLPIALLMSAIWGVVEIGWAIGVGRLLFTRVVPSEKRGEYMAVFYAIVGVVGGLSQIFSGVLLDATSHVSGQLWILPVDQFTPLFLGSLVLMVAAIVVFSRVHPDSDVSVGEFAGMFVHGNPVLALRSVAGYYQAKDERSMVEVTERMGATKSMLTVEELLETLVDPRFNVRFEAIISIARMGPDPRLVEAVSGVLDGTEISLSVIAAWALGRMGSDAALPALRRGLHSTYRSLQVHCARSLGTLGDQTVAPLLLERLMKETDKGVRMAFASALGNLCYEPALRPIFDMLDETENEGARMELALAVARAADGEQRFIPLLRGLRGDLGTSASQAILPLKRRLDKASRADFIALIDHCAHTFARNQFDSGTVELAGVIDGLLSADVAVSEREILTECAQKLRQYKAARLEYLVLALLMFQLL